MIHFLAQQTLFCGYRSRAIFISRVLLLLHYVLLIATPSRVLLILAAAPPHLAGPFGLVRATAPVHVFFLNEVFATLLADQEI